MSDRVHIVTSPTRWCWLLPTHVSTRPQPTAGRRAFCVVRRVAGRFGTARTPDFAHAGSRRSTTRTTPPTSWSSRASRRSGSGPACTSGPPTPAASCTACGRSSTTAWTRRSPAHAHRVEVTLHRRRLRRGARRRPRHPDRQGAQDRAARRRGRRDQAARRRQVRRRLVRRHRRPARRRPLGRQRALRADGHRRRPLAVASRASASAAACPASSTATGRTRRSPRGPG